MLKKSKPKKILVTGAYGFIGKNLVCTLNEKDDIEVLKFGRSDSEATLNYFVNNADAIVHLAGENRPRNISDFTTVNKDLTRLLCEMILRANRNIPFIFTSSIQAEKDNDYGKSKLAAEQIVKSFVDQTENTTAIYRLPGVFGKWCRPNYNSVVATFCYNIANNLPIHVKDFNTSLKLVYIDDLIASFITFLSQNNRGLSWQEVTPNFSVSLGDLAVNIEEFKKCRDDLVIPRVGEGFLRALYSTYVSYLPTSKFSYAVENHSDARGNFVEMLKTQDSGQFSYFTAAPGVTRGGHYHHSKTEKFLIIKGRALYKFKSLETKKELQVFSSGSDPTVVESIPGWAHSITNIGSEELVVMLWANEIFDPKNTDTIAFEM